MHVRERIFCSVRPKGMSNADWKKVQSACSKYGNVDLDQQRTYLETIVLLTYDILHIYGPPLSNGKQDETKVASQNQKDSSKSSRAAHQFVSKGCEHGCVGSVDAAKMGGEWSSSTANSLDCDFCESESDEEDEADGSEDGEADLLHDEGLAELLGS